MNSHSHGLSHMNYHYHSHSTDHSSSPPSLFVQAPSHAHTMNSSFTALAVPSTCFLAATVEENGAGFTGVSKISPGRFPSLACRVLIPSPCIKLWDILLDSSCLIPVEAGLQQCSWKRGRVVRPVTSGDQDTCWFHEQECPYSFFHLQSQSKALWGRVC